MIRWHDKELMKELEGVFDKRLKKAGIAVVGEAKRLLGVQGRPAKASGSRTTHSQPGEPPRWQTKTLRQSITRQRVGDEERVGTNVIYARFLEIGTRTMAPRPYLRPALSRSQRNIVKILTEPIA